VAERRAAAPRSPRRPAGAPMHIRAVMRSCAMVRAIITSNIELGRPADLREAALWFFGNPAPLPNGTLGVGFNDLLWRHLT